MNYLINSISDIFTTFAIQNMKEEKEKPAEDDKKESNDEEKQKMYNDLQTDFKDFQKIQKGKTSI